MRYFLLLLFFCLMPLQGMCGVPASIDTVTSKIVCFFCRSMVKSEPIVGKENRYRCLNMNCKKLTYECDDCNKTYQSSRHVRSHRSKHLDDKAHTCDICNRSYKTIGNLNAHKCQNNHKRSCQCVYCINLFQHPQHLQYIQYLRNMASHSASLCARAQPFLYGSTYMVFDPKRHPYCFRFSPYKRPDRGGCQPPEGMYRDLVHCPSKPTGQFNVEKVARGVSVYRNQEPVKVSMSKNPVNQVMYGAYKQGTVSQTGSWNTVNGVTLDYFLRSPKPESGFRNLLKKYRTRKDHI